MSLNKCYGLLHETGDCCSELGMNIIMGSLSFAILSFHCCLCGQTVVCSLFVLLICKVLKEKSAKFKTRHQMRLLGTTLKT